MDPHPAPSRSGRSCLPSCSRQQHVVADDAVCAGASQGLLPDLGKWTTLLALRCVAPKWPGTPHQIPRRSPFWCSQICCTWFLFFMNGSMSSKDILLFDRAEHASPPKQDSWCCGSPRGGRTETRLPVSGGSQNRPPPENAQILSATHHDPSSCAISKRSRKEQVPASHA